MEGLSEREWVIGLHDFHGASQPQKVFAGFHELVIEELTQLGLDLTYVGIEGDGYTGKATKAHGAAFKRVKDAEFNGISVLNLICNPKGSNSPAYDRFFSASLNITSYNDNLLTLCVNDGLLGFGSGGFQRILKRVASLHDWTTGYAFVDLSSRQPEFHVMGLDDGNLSSDEYCRLTKWYTSTREDKLSRIRAIYPFNLLNRRQLQQRLANGQTVREFAESFVSSELITGGFGQLALWIVPESELASVRSTLDGCYAVIA